MVIPEPGRGALPVDRRRHCSLWVFLVVAGTFGCVAPEADYWKNRRKHARPLPHVTLQQAWDYPTTGCPEKLSDAGDGRVLLHGVDGFMWMDASGVTAPASPVEPQHSTGAEEELIRQVLQRHFGEPVQATSAAIWRDLAMVVVPDRGTAHAVHLGKERVVWTVRTGSRMVVAPQVYRSRVIVQSLDNYIYCLVADNGHGMRSGAPRPRTGSPDRLPSGKTAYW